jgi:transposase
MWKPEHRAAADRRGLRYPSDLTDAEWAIIAPLIPPAKRGGRPRTVNVREVLNAIFYVLSTGCQWEAMPKDLPPKSTAWDYLDLWNWDGTLERVHHALYGAVREGEGREAQPSAAIIDSQSAKAAQKGAPRLTRKASTPAIRARRPAPPWPGPGLGCSRSSSAPTCRASRSCRNAGSSSARWLGSAAAAASCATWNVIPAPSSPSSASP